MNKLMLTAVLFLTGCAHLHSQQELESRTYLVDSREDFMLQYEPTGSPCLDAFQINLAYAGCSELQTGGGDEDGLVYLRCAGGSSGATDFWSTAVFTILTEPEIIPDYIHVLCIDQVTMLGVLVD
jgi:hypothetical protein